MKSRLFARCCLGALCLAASGVAAAQEAPQAAPPREVPLRLPAPGTPASSPGGSALNFGAEFDQDSALFAGTRPSDATRGVTVTRRARPEFDAVGSRVAGFRLDAQASLSAGIDTNVYRVTDSPSDVFALGELEATLQSDWSQHALEIKGNLRHRQFASETLRDLTTYRFEAQGELDLSPQARLNGAIVRRHDARDQFSAEDVTIVLRPVEFDETKAEIRGRYESGRVVLSANGGYARVDYESSATLDGVLQPLRDRDYDSYVAGGQVGYRVSSGAVAFVSASHEWRRYLVDATPRRDSNALEVLGGIESEITPLLFGRVAVGFLRTNFSDPSVPSRDSFAIDTRLDYLVTQLTTVHLSVRRTLRDAALLTAPATLVTNFRLSADHELLRNVIVSPQVFYETADYVGTDQSADLIGGGVDAKWLINRRFRVNLSASYRSRATHNVQSGREYDALVAMAGVTVAL